MAEFGQPGLMAVLLLCSALTLRDVYVGRSNPVRGQQQPGDHADPQPATTERGRAARSYLGPVLRFQYCISCGYSKAYQEYARAISQLYPDIHIQGENYPPTAINRCLGNLVSYLKLLAIVVIVTGQNVFAMLGMPTPRAWTWSQDNKIFSCLMAFFLCNMMETHFLSTGAFEVTLNDVPVWSKLQSGYVPNIQEIFQILDRHLKMNQVDPQTFSA